MKMPIFTTVHYRAEAGPTVLYSGDSEIEATATAKNYERFKPGTCEIYISKSVADHVIEDTPCRYGVFVSLHNGEGYSASDFGPFDTEKQANDFVSKFDDAEFGRRGFCFVYERS